MLDVTMGTRAEMRSGMRIVVVLKFSAVLCGKVAGLVRFTGVVPKTGRVQRLCRVLRAGRWLPRLKGSK